MPRNRAAVLARGTIELATIFPDPTTRARYLNALHRLSMRTISVSKLAYRTGLEPQHVRAALRTDTRFAKVNAPGPERYALRNEHKHAATLQHAHAAMIASGIPTAPAARAAEAT